MMYEVDLDFYSRLYKRSSNQIQFVRLEIVFHLFAFFFSNRKLKENVTHIEVVELASAMYSNKLMDISIAVRLEKPEKNY